MRSRCVCVRTTTQEKSYGTQQRAEYINMSALTIIILEMMIVFDDDDDFDDNTF